MQHEKRCCIPCFIHGDLGGNDFFFPLVAPAKTDRRWVSPSGHRSTPPPPRHFSSSPRCTASSSRHFCSPTPAARCHGFLQVHPRRAQYRPSLPSAGAGPRARTPCFAVEGLREAGGGGEEKEEESAARGRMKHGEGEDTCRSSESPAAARQREDDDERGLTTLLCGT